MKCAGGVEVYPTLRYRTESIKPAAVNGLGRQNTTFTYIQYIVFSFFYGYWIGEGYRYQMKEKAGYWYTTIFGSAVSSVAEPVGAGTFWSEPV